MQESDGETAFMIAVCNGHTDCVKLLLKKEAGMQDEDGRTALMGAADHDHIECIKLLLEKEAGMRDKNGWTALMFVTYNNRLGCARLLAEREGDMETTRGWWGFPLAQQPLISQRGRAALQSPPSSVASMLIPSCAIPSDPAGRSASSSGAQTGPVCPRLRPLLGITSCAGVSACPPRSTGTACEASSRGPLGTAGGPVQPGSSPRPRPAHVHHLASGWSCRRN